MITLRGAEVSEKLKTQVQESLNGLGRVPRLAIVRVGESPDDISYEKGAVKKMAAFGLEAVKYTFPENIPDQEFKTAFGRINSDPKIDGILVFRPLPEQIVQEDIDRMIDPLKDLDGISPVNIAKVFSGDNTGFAPCTAEAVMDILRFNGISRCSFFFFIIQENETLCFSFLLTTYFNFLKLFKLPCSAAALREPGAWPAQRSSQSLRRLALA